MFGANFGLERTQKFAALAGNPQTQLRFIHIAGTNGKGSTSAMLESIYRAAGLRVGLFTSPHLVSFRERIQINRQMISEADVTRLVAELQLSLKGFSAEQHPTMFEVVTVMSLKFFAEQKCDLVIWETGLGGRLDATNIVTPAVSGITPSGLDHMQHLGSTLAEIAGEKAGIIKPGSIVLSAPQPPEAEAVIRTAAGAAGAKLKFITEPIASEIPLALAGSHQRRNASLAFAAIIEAGLRPDPRVVREAFAKVSWPARFQRTDERTVIDGAHNPHAATQLAATWREEFGDEKAVLILGILGDKDAAGVIAALLPIAARIICTPVRSPRALAPSDLAAMIRAQSPALPVSIAESLETALAEARTDGNRILIAGSLFLAGEALVRLSLAEGEHEWSAQ